MNHTYQTLLINTIPCHHILVGGFHPSEKYESQWDDIPYVMENNKSLKPPTSIWIYL